ncbi:MAG: aminodeoxychorismate synthase component I [Pseudomonadales bacterium]|nr:aminodeoxychorismate synthase component I [Pseudomonadales bacterium]
MITESFPYNSSICHFFNAFAHAPQAFLFDSGKPDQEQGHIDIFSAWPTKTMRSDGKDLANIKQTLSKDWQSQHIDLPFCGGWMGFASYELGYALEEKSGDALPNAKLPLFFAGYYPWAFIVDHDLQTAQLIYEPDIDKALLSKIQQGLKKSDVSYPDFLLSQAFKPLTSWQQYQYDFNQIQQYLTQGDCYQVNYAQAYQATFKGSAYLAYKKLRHTVPSPFMVYANIHHKGEEQTILSISPERFLKAVNQQLETKPIKGTAGRSSDKAQDQKIALSLQASEKNRAENLMIVDLLRNDFGRDCEVGSIKVDQLFAIESYANVHHLVSTITGIIKEDKNIWDVFFSAFPGGSITGAPKIRASQIINELEQQRREIYCGSLFYASNNGRFDSSIAIRTLLAEKNHITAWAGGGIVKDSCATDEFQECQHKIGTLLKALENQS